MLVKQLTLNLKLKAFEKLEEIIRSTEVNNFTQAIHKTIEEFVIPNKEAGFSQT